jgi:hypothetical protein
MTAGLVIRHAVPADATALRRLASLDDARPLRGDQLVALVDGEIRAALALAGGRIVADPFVRTAELVDLLRMRATQLEANPPLPSAIWHPASPWPTTASSARS